MEHCNPLAAVEGNRLAEAEDDCTLAEIEADHSLAEAGADRSRVAVEAGHSPAAEGDIHPVAVRNHLPHRNDPAEVRHILDYLADDCLVHLSCHRKNRWHQGGV